MEETPNTPPENTEEPDLRGWDIERDGRMNDFGGLPTEFDIEPWNPKKDPVLKGLVPNPYDVEEDDGA